MSAPGLPDFERTVSLDPETIAAFHDRGHAVVRGLASAAELEPSKPAIERNAVDRAWDQRPLAERDTYGKAFIQMFNLWRQNELAKAFVFSRRFACAAAELMGVSGVRLYHDQALFKEPGGGPTPWHQDRFYWPLDTTHTITLWIPLDPAAEEMGLMTFASGSHRFGSLGDFAIGDESQAQFDRVIEEKGLPRTASSAFALGDASFHSGWTLHSAPPNRTGRLRESMTVIYFSDGTRVGALDHPNRRFDRDAWLRGCEPGELAAGQLNPLLYPARER